MKYEEKIFHLGFKSFKINSRIIVSRLSIWQSLYFLSTNLQRKILAFSCVNWSQSMTNTCISLPYLSKSQFILRNKHVKIYTDLFQNSI